MNSISPEGSTPLGKKGETVPQEPAKQRSLHSVEAAVDQIGKLIVKEEQKIKTKAVEVQKEIRSSTPEEKSKLEHPEIALQAVKSVKNEQKLHSIHEKWGFRFREYLEKEDLRDVATRVARRRRDLARMKEMYRSLQASESPLQKDVRELLKTGSLTPEKGGLGGAYFLRDQKGNPKYVIKPGDEALYALNNRKNLASPFVDTDFPELPLRGTLIYETVQNAELSYLTAKLFGLEEITPKTEVMIIEHPVFHDILDGTIEKDNLDFRQLPASKEKLCSVQEYVEGCWDIGSLLCVQSKLKAEEIKKLMRENPGAYEALEQEHTPRDVDQTRYEQIAVFTFLIGECDGNSGSYLCSKAPAENGIRSLLKIDNDATFPEHNDQLASGLVWFVHNYSLELSGNIRSFIQNIDEKKAPKLKAWMLQRGKSVAAIRALDDRIKYLKEYALRSTTMEDLDRGITFRDW